MPDSPSKPKVLLVEDNKDLSSALEELLAANGVQVFVAKDGVTGIETARREKPAMILLDLLLPKVNGFEVCRTLKSDPGTRLIPIVIVSTLTKESDMQRARECGANHFIKKPYDIGEILKEVQRLLKSR